MKRKYFLLLTIMVLAFSCAPQKEKKDDLTRVTEWMTGEFSSEAQSLSDTTYFNISLVMQPIWENDQEAKWLYVEQAVASKKDKPYRQRVYKITQEEEGTIKSAIYELPDASKYVHAWENATLFDEITPDSLTSRVGCAVYLKKVSETEYAGATNQKDCESSLYGATYATSEVTVHADQIVSWDRGWDQEDVQIWGAKKGGYIFKKITE